MKAISYNMKPQDIVILLKLISLENEMWQQKPLAESLKMSQSEISECVARCKYSGLMDSSGKKVMRNALFNFLESGIAYVYPQRPGTVVRGIATAHSAEPLSKSIASQEIYVWPYAKGKVKGHSIAPLYVTVPDAALADAKLYELLALTDALRAGKVREKQGAIAELKKRFF